MPTTHLTLALWLCGAGLVLTLAVVVAGFWAMHRASARTRAIHDLIMLLIRKDLW